MGSDQPGPGTRQGRLPQAGQLADRGRGHPRSRPGGGVGHEGFRHRVRHRGIPAADGGAGRERPPPRGIGGGRAGRPDRADAPLVPDPDLRRRHERGAARHHRRGRPGAPGGPALTAAGLERLMDFFLNDDQQELSALARRVLSDRVTEDRLREIEAGGDRFDPALWADLASAGILAAALPESLGGAGLGLLEQCSVLAEIGRAVAPAPYLASIVLGASALARFGTSDQQRQWAEPAGRGELVLSAALSEEDGDDPRAPAVSAERVKREWRGTGRRAGGGRWLLSGAKTAVLAGPLADLMLVPAATPEGVTVFLVAPGDDGVTIERQQVTGGDSAGRLV